MSANFIMVGKIKKPKSEKIKLYESGITKSGKGTSNVTKFNLDTGSSNFLLESRGYLANKESEQIIYSFTKAKDGKKGEPIKFSYKDRDKYIGEVAEFKKFVIKNNDEDSKYEFVSEFDFAEKIATMIENGSFEDKQVRIDGEIIYNHYIDKNGENRYLKKYSPKRITVFEKEEKKKETYAQATIEFYFDSDALFEKEEKVYNLDCKINQYNSEFKMETLYPEIIELNFKNKSNEAMNFMINKLGLDKIEMGKLNKLSLKVDMINGAEKVELTEDMLTDDERDMLNFGFTTMADLRREKGMGIGSFISKFVMKGMGRGYSTGAKETDKTVDDFTPKTETMDSIVNSLVDEEDVPF